MGLGVGIGVGIGVGLGVGLGVGSGRKIPTDNQRVKCQVWDVRVKGGITYAGPAPILAECRSTERLLL